ncbi:AAA-domain-containing protein [Daldinia caldariorum]|uniref:AAA-domain-containing protein n=1 Tax=Daldinia caldariorum TaxID=326644 RepID=UPI002008C6AD|nr:AAA-domain-containing protein [Daldinia caldariorum]KAI1470063.1 AAA-domain-containing protein [Daldinia caldariorum]
MAPAQRKNAQSVAAEISLVHLKNCLVNLPTSLVNLLVTVNTPAQNVIVELNYRVPLPTNGSSQANGSSSSQRSLYLGWTGMPSKRKVAPIVDRDGISGTRGSGRDQEVASVEIDATLARTLGLSDGQKVTATIHVDPILAHTVNIEPVTSEDWEIIELHATFLELNLLSQIRALPNPVYTASPGQPPSPHPLTLHLSPTSTANIRIVSLEPALPPNVPFAKIAPDAEVVVAPKTRSKPSKGTREDRSVGGTSRRSAKSSTSTVRRKSAREEKKPSLFLRGIDRKLCDEWFDDESAPQDLSVWVDRDLLLSKEFRGVTWVVVNIVKPAGLQPPLDPQKQQENAANGETIKATEKVVARLHPWDDPPTTQTIALSTPLCAVLGCIGIVGGIAKIEPAPAPLSRTSIQKIKVSPFSIEDLRNSAGLKFGGESKAEKEEASKKVSHIYGQKDKINGLLQGPLTDGMILPVYDTLQLSHGWEGGILKLEGASIDDSKERLSWYLGSEKSVPIEVQPPAPRPAWLVEDEITDQKPASDSVLVGIDSLLTDLKSHLTHMSSVLLSGALGAGKTAVVQSLAQTLREEFLFHTTYFPCRKLVNDESRISTIKETLNRIFMGASWGARLGGKALVILDDLDKLCPVETELQVGNDNSRSRQVSETISSIVHQYCGRDRGVVLLATAQGKESLNNVIIGGHVVREIVELKAPDKEARRKVLEAIVKQQTVARGSLPAPEPSGSRPTTANGSIGGDDTDTWMDGADQLSPKKSISTNLRSEGFLLDPDLDFLDLAGETDGYMPGDLILLVSRARNEALIRSVSEDPSNESLDVVQLGRADFDNALKGFTPASLRNVPLQTSTTTFDSIGGLKETRQILLETLQYPTKYAPIFAQCPLRLRSGLLLYGFPGCGKTLLASAVAGECGLNFISVKGPEILNKYIGASEKSVRDLFERASAAKPCVLFFDEFDSIAPKRGHDSTGVTDRVVNQLLTQMDGAEGLSGVYVLAATSRPDLIDPALLRPGRLDKSLLCGFPTVEDRADILKALSKKVKLSKELVASEESFLELAKRTEGFSGADLQALISNAQLEAIHDVLKDIELQPSGDKRNGADSRAKASTSASNRNFIQFRYGIEAALAEAEEKTKKGYNKSTQLAENAAMAAKLSEIKAAKKQTKLGQKRINHNSRDTSDKGKEGNNTEVLIGWRHVVKALESTRASISPQERNRLERIYREFVVGRSGEMRDGQGSMEIGGRSSLM